MKNVLVDTGFWYSYLGTREVERHRVAQELYHQLDKIEANFIIPFPTFYEAINTKLLKEKNHTAADWFLKKLQSDPHFIKIYDDDFRNIAYGLTIKDNYRGYSLVDNIIRVMLDSDSFKIDALLTFNIEDFCDVTAKRNIEIPKILYEK